MALSVRPSVRPSVRASGAPLSLLDAKKCSKQFKTNGLGSFLGAHLARLGAKTCFLEPLMMAQDELSEGGGNIVEPMLF